jgi:hypothetical protein
MIEPILADKTVVITNKTAEFSPTVRANEFVVMDLACTQECRITSCNSRTANWLNFLMSFRRISFDLGQLCATSTSSSDAGGSECILTA